MARYTGAVRFRDGTLMFFVYDGTVDCVRPRLYLTEVEADGMWHEQTGQGHYDRPGDEEEVEVMPYFTVGDSKVAFMSRASKSLGLITGAREARDAALEE